MSGCPVKNNDTSGGSGACPVKNLAPGTSVSGLQSWFGWAGLGEKQVQSGTVIDGTAQQGYNAAANDEHFDPSAKFPGQKRDLSGTRTVSTIPKSNQYTPKHQPDGLGNWVYPSEQQYFNAMKRKGYDPSEDDMSVILAIHNTVNELGWSRILEWEALRGCKTPILKRFMGRPKDLSPKARILVALGKDPPFDRHDWVIERDDGKEVRYVIDFYAIESNGGGHGVGAPVHLDVRPALDSPGAFLDRLQWTLGLKTPR